MAFTILPDGIAAIAYGDFDQDAPRLTSRSASDLSTQLTRTGSRPATIAELLRCAALPGHTCCLVFEGGRLTNIFDTHPGEDGVVPIHPHVWIWQHLRAGYLAEGQ